MTRDKRAQAVFTPGVVLAIWITVGLITIGLLVIAAGMILMVTSC